MSEKYFLFDKTKDRALSDVKLLEHRLERFSRTKNANEADFIVSFGGDGTLLDCFNKFPHKKIYPIRDYKICERHQTLIDPIYAYHTFDVLNLVHLFADTECEERRDECKALSEIVIRNTDISTAMRCNLYINDNLYAKNIIGDGIIFATSLGSTGYFKNVTHTFFTKGNIGIGFINNAQNMANFVIPIDSKIKVEIVRAGNKKFCDVACDHKISNFWEGKSFEIQKAKFSARLINYKDEFMCQDCRNERHAANVNSIYKVI